MDYRNGGGSGIRTHGRLPYTRFRIERLKPDSAIPPFFEKLQTRLAVRLTHEGWARKWRSLWQEAYAETRLASKMLGAA